MIENLIFQIGITLFITIVLSLFGAWLLATGWKNIQVERKVAKVMASNRG